MKCPVCNGRGLWRLYGTYVCEWFCHECHACSGTGRMSFRDYIVWRFYDDWDIIIGNSAKRRYKLHLTDILQILWHGKSRRRR